MNPLTKKVLPLLLAVCLNPSFAAAELEVLSAVGVVAPEGLEAGQRLADGARLELEPWGRVLARETAQCGLTHIVVGQKEHTLAMTDDCSQSGEESQVVADKIQRGEVFATRVKETESGPANTLVMALSLDSCVYLPRVSEEGDNSRECPSGHALNGLRCTGAYCDNKDLMCCPYLEGAPDPTVKPAQARQISEEFPNISTTKNFFNGLTCWGPYCDNVLPNAFKSSRLKNTRKCTWSAWNSDGPSSWLVCGEDQFVAGLRCRDEYCGDVGLNCCQARVE